MNKPKIKWLVLIATVIGGSALIAGYEVVSGGTMQDSVAAGVFVLFISLILIYQALRQRNKR